MPGRVVDLKNLRVAATACWLVDFSEGLSGGALIVYVFCSSSS